MRLVPIAALGVAALLASGCTSLDPLYRSERSVPTEALVAAGESDAAEDSAALVLLADLALRSEDLGPHEETLATTLEALGTRAEASTLPEQHRALALQVAEELALDELRDPVVRMTALELLGMLGDDARRVLATVRDEAADPLVADHAARVLGERSAAP